MKRIPNGTYTPELRAEAVRLVESGSLSMAAAAKQLSIPKSSLFNWVQASKKGKLAEVGKHQRTPTELEMELARVRKELAEVKLERDLLMAQGHVEKCTASHKGISCGAYFAKASQ